MVRAIDSEFSDLIARLYGGIDDGPPWQSFLEALGEVDGINIRHADHHGTGQALTWHLRYTGHRSAAPRRLCLGFFADDPFCDLAEGQVTSLTQFVTDNPRALFPAYRQYLRLAGDEQVLVWIYGSVPSGPYASRPAFALAAITPCRILRQWIGGLRGSALNEESTAIWCYRPARGFARNPFWHRRAGAVSDFSNRRVGA